MADWFGDEEAEDTALLASTRSADRLHRRHRR